PWRARWATAALPTIPAPITTTWAVVGAVDMATSLDGRVRRAAGTRSQAVALVPVLSVVSAGPRIVMEKRGGRKGRRAAPGRSRCEDALRADRPGRAGTGAPMSDGVEDAAKEAAEGADRAAQD